jgi:hypothetical protein
MEWTSLEISAVDDLSIVERNKRLVKRRLSALVSWQQLHVFRILLDAMKNSTKPGEAGKEQQLLRNARRESLLIMIVWAAALVWSIVISSILGYGRDAAAVPLVLGMPDWVFWSIVLPWGLCLAFTVWFCFGYMADDDLGRDPEETAANH